MATRETIALRARDLIRQNPTWGRRKVQSTLVGQFGRGLRTGYLDQIKRSVTGAPKRVARPRAFEPEFDPDGELKFKGIFDRYAISVKQVYRRTEMYAVLEFDEPIDSKGKVKKYITIPLGEMTYAEFRAKRQSGWIYERIRRVTAVIWHRPYTIVGYWALKPKKKKYR